MPRPWKADFRDENGNWSKSKYAKLKYAEDAEVFRARAAKWKQENKKKVSAYHRQKSRERYLADPNSYHLVT